MIRIVRLGSPRAQGEGVRLGTVRRPPRGVKKADIGRLDYYDLWLPELSPSAELVKQAQSASTAADWHRFRRRYRGEMAVPAASRMLDLLVLLSRQADLAVGCYCEDESHCHRSVLRELLIERGAEFRK
jgi:uncharacterized protein YeaO (DUF488 family)